MLGLFHSRMLMSHAVQCSAKKVPRASKSDWGDVGRREAHVEYMASSLACRPVLDTAMAAFSSEMACIRYWDWRKISGPGKIPWDTTVDYIPTPMQSRAKVSLRWVLCSSISRNRLRLM